MGFNKSKVNKSTKNKTYKHTTHTIHTTHTNKTRKGGSSHGKGMGKGTGKGTGKGSGKGKGGLWFPPDPHTEALEHAQAMREEADRAYQAAHGGTGAMGGYNPVAAQYATFMAQVAYEAQEQADAIGVEMARLSSMSQMSQMSPRGMGMSQMGMSPMSQMSPMGMSPMSPMSQMSPMGMSQMSPMSAAMPPPSLKRTTSFSIELHDELLHNPDLRRLFEDLLLATNGETGGKKLRLAKDTRNPKYYQSRGYSGLFYNWSEHGVPICHLTLHNQKGHGDPTHNSRTNVGSFHVKMNGSNKSRRIIINFNRSGDGFYEITLCETVQQQFDLAMPIDPEPDPVLDALSEKIVRALMQYYKDTGRQVKRSFHCSK